MVQVIEFRPRETRIKRQPPTRPADVIPMPARKQSFTGENKLEKSASLSAMIEFGWPRTTD